MKVWFPGMYTLESFKVPLKLRKEAGKGFEFMGCEIPCHDLHHQSTSRSTQAHALLCDMPF